MDRAVHDARHRRRATELQGPVRTGGKEGRAVKMAAQWLEIDGISGGGVIAAMASQPQSMQYFILPRRHKVEPSALAGGSQVQLPGGAGSNPACAGRP